MSDRPPSSASLRPLDGRLLLFTLGVLLGCGRSNTSLDPGPTAGAGGGGPQAGGGGGGTPASGGFGAVPTAGGSVGGMGGPPPTEPTCNTPTTSGDVIFELHATDQSFVMAPVSDRVTVRSVDRCANGVCSTLTLYGTPTVVPDAAVRIVLARSAESSDPLTLYLHIPAMPDGYFVAGDVYDLVLDASLDSVFVNTINQTLTLSEDGRLMVLGVNLASFRESPLPTNLDGGLTVVDGGVSCVQPGSPCGRADRAVLVAQNSSSAIIAPGETALVGTLSFTCARRSQVLSQGSCDVKSSTLMAAFETKPCHGSAPAACTSGPSSRCGDTEDYQVCQGGTWVCPDGTVLLSSCTAFGFSASGCQGGPD